MVLLSPLLVTIETLFNPDISRRALTIVKRVMIKRSRERERELKPNVVSTCKELDNM